MRIVPIHIFAASGLIFLASCVSVDRIDPVVASFNEASVEIQLDGTLFSLAGEEVKAAAFAKADAKAAEICMRGPNRRAEYASTRTIPTGQYSSVINRLYLCLR